MANKQLRNNIKVFRARDNLTQEQLAIKVGVTRKTINAIEGGNYAPSVSLALSIAGVFRASVNDIFTLV